MQFAMIKGKYILSILVLVLALNSCRKDVIDKYERPEWLEGKVYTQILKYEDLSTFAKCLEITKYDTVINVSGSYTVFAPTNEAFELFFKENPNYKSLEDIPLEKLTNIVKYHILQNPWSKDQLRSLDIYGWIDEDDEYNNKPRGYKRQTILLNKDKKYGIKINPLDIDEVIIVDSTKSSWNRRIITDSRKYAPIFYQEYFSINNLNLSDYSFYFNRSFDSPENIYYVNAKVFDDDIFAENGFVYKVDRVVEPLKNASEILADEKYSKFLELINQFPSLNYNEEKTFKQPGASQGLMVDSLFDLSFPDLTFNIYNEITKAPTGLNSSSNSTIRFHHGLMAPTNNAFDEFIKEYIENNNSWGSLDLTPIKVKRIIAKTYFSINSIYETDINKGFFNAELDEINLDNSSIIDKRYGSNCTFIGMDKAIVPRAFSSVTGPVYLKRGYKTVLNAIEFSGLLSSLKKSDTEKTLLVVSDLQLNRDSSLIYIYKKFDNSVLESFKAVTVFPTIKEYNLNQSDLRTLLLNHVAVETPQKLASIEFLETLSGNHMIWNNVNGTVQGTSKSTIGFLGATPIDVVPIQISSNADNGTTYEINSWLNYKSEEIFSIISNKFPEFHQLLNKAGFSLPKEYRYNFLSSNKRYTIFVPSAKAIQDVQADTLSNENLERFIKLHFIEGDLIFTDGKNQPGYYATTYNQTISGTTQTKNIKLKILPGIDEINVAGKSGNTFVKVELTDKSNLISAKIVGEIEGVVIPATTTTGVIHQVDKAFMFDLLDTN